MNNILCIALVFAAFGGPCALQVHSTQPTHTPKTFKCEDKIDDDSKKVILDLGKAPSAELNLPPSTTAEQLNDEEILKGLPKDFTFCKLYTGVSNGDNKEIKQLSKNFKENIKLKIDCFGKRINSGGIKVVCKKDSTFTL